MRIIIISNYPKLDICWTNLSEMANCILATQNDGILNMVQSDRILSVDCSSEIVGVVINTQAAKINTRPGIHPT